MEKSDAPRDPRGLMLSIVVPVWNQVRTTLQFILELRPQLQDTYELILINNGSTDRTKKALRGWKLMLGDQLVVIENEENRGFGPASNQGARKAKGEFLVFLNNDVNITGDFATPIIQALNTIPELMVCGRLIDWDGGWNRFEALLIPYCEGWCMGIRKELFWELGGFDERFIPCDYEDVALSYLAQQRGVELRELDLPLRHRGGSTAQSLKDRLKITKSNRKLFAEEYLGDLK